VCVCVCTCAHVGAGVGVCASVLQLYNVTLCYSNYTEDALSTVNIAALI